MEESEVSIEGLKAKCLKRLEEWKKDPRQMAVELKAADELFDSTIEEFIEKMRTLFVTKAVELSILGRAVVLFATDDENHVPAQDPKVTVGTRMGCFTDSCIQEIIQYLAADGKEDE